jgi:hypothetical protein
MEGGSETDWCVRPSKLSRSARKAHFQRVYDEAIGRRQLPLRRSVPTLKLPMNGARLANMH